jgi:hypothetical protein
MQTTKKKNEDELRTCSCFKKKSLDSASSNEKKCSDVLYMKTGSCCATRYSTRTTFDRPARGTLAYNLATQPATGMIFPTTPLRARDAVISDVLP